ncbi:uncharacterized protein [Drosophila virilis]|uniref:Uncharacterized protein n=1 Tax=Drosophila virilis TaxID=7244 RepID=A0A0Q9W3K4_DROVI|nr:uncharacterized protein LOC26531440 [Drosophila virilis]KRF79674.1 uncharacterized protein Dvir_GJ26670 [Drosophila virilis]
MPVAVRLVEALAIVTLMALITCVSLGVVIAQRTLSLTITFIEPAANILDVVLIMAEKMFIGALVSTVALINTVCGALHMIGFA